MNLNLVTEAHHLCQKHVKWMDAMISQKKNHMHNQNVGIEPLKARHDVTKLKLTIHLLFF